MERFTVQLKATLWVLELSHNHAISEGVGLRLKTGEGAECKEGRGKEFMYPSCVVTDILGEYCALQNARAYWWGQQCLLDIKVCRERYKGCCPRISFKFANIDMVNENLIGKRGVNMNDTVLADRFKSMACSVSKEKHVCCVKWKFLVPTPHALC
jgi:hypothetical protein